MKKMFIAILATLMLVQSNSVSASSYYSSAAKEMEMTDFAENIDALKYDSLSDSEYENLMSREESEGVFVDENANLTEAEIAAKTAAETSLETVTAGELGAVESDIVTALQQDALSRVKGRGNWVFEFKYIDKATGKVTTLTSYDPHGIVKPASTLKVFTGWLAYRNQAYPISSLGVMLHKSNNAMADASLRNVAKKMGYKEIEKNGVDELIKGGVKVMKNTYSDFVDGSKFDPKNGSGLNNYASDSYSDWNKVTAALQINLLQRIYTADGGAHYNTFKKLLAQPGQYGTLRRRLGSAQRLGRVYAKTGTLQKTKSLTGFVDMKKGTLMFSIIGDQLNISCGSAMTHIDNIVYKHVQYLANKGL